MKSIDVINPTAIKYPVAIEGDKNTIPLNVTGSQLASIKGGFPLITETPVAEGGKPPVRKDFNGLFYLATDYKAFLQDGGYITFSQTVSDLIGGYPKGAILDYYTSGTNSYTKVVSLIDDNAYNFVTTPSYVDGAKWQFVNFGGANQDLSNLSADGNDFINQSKAMTTGSVSDNAVVYADILSRLHTSFDSTKFTVTGTPTITDNGIASGFSTANCVKIANPSFNLGNADSWRVEFAFETGNSWSTYGERLYQWEYTVNKGLVPYISATGTFVMPIHDQNGDAILASADFSNNQLSVNTKYYGYCEFTGTSYTVKIGTNRDNLTTICQKTTSTKINDGINVYYIGSKLDQSSFSGKIDLKNVVVIADGVTVFTGNKTGSDSYTVDGNTVTIPYTVTSGGAKIADYASLSDIQDVFNAGYTEKQYLTIDENNVQFTLPQGMSVYEGIASRADFSLSNINASAINDIFLYNQPADTYTALTLGASGSTYTATDNGFFYLRAVGSSFRMYDATTGYGVEPSSTTANIYVTGVLPVRKGQVITIDYTIMDAGNVFRFFKARGV